MPIDPELYNACDLARLEMWRRGVRPLPTIMELYERFEPEYRAEIARRNQEKRRRKKK